MSDLPRDLLRDMWAFAQCEDEDRFEFLRAWLRRCGLGGKKLEIGGRRHLLVRFDAPYPSHEKIKIFVSHYDRVPGSPGGNDNGAAVFQLLCHAARLSGKEDVGSTQILFTDGEELLSGPPTGQGSYGLASLFRSQRVNDCRFYVFDMCGIGDSLVLGAAGALVLDQALKEFRVTADFHYTATAEIAAAAVSLEKFHNRPVERVVASFSDDLGFLLNGYSAASFSVLPRAEALAAEANREAVLADPASIVALKKGYFSPEFKKIMKKHTPPTWQTWHTPEDTPDKLERRAFVLMERFLTFLSFGNLPSN